jgi:two-component system, NarL family, sensor histidine kinase UhpB
LAEPNFLELLVESMGTISAAPTEDVLEQARIEAERLFGAHAELAAEAAAERASNGHRLEVPLRARVGELGVLRLERERPFQRVDVARATVLADFAVRASENARLLAEQARLSEQLITAEQEERRRLANELHDGAVQSLSGIALMLDAVGSAIDHGRLDDAKRITASALERHRETIRSLRDLSFSLEPVVLRDQGFSPALRALAERVALANKIQIDVDVEAAEALAEKAQADVYQIVREALNQAVRRGPPQRISIRVGRTEDGGFDTVISDDAPGERRLRSFDAIAERARTLNGRLSIEQGEDGGTAVHVLLPPYTERR